MECRIVSVECQPQDLERILADSEGAHVLTDDTDVLNFEVLAVSVGVGREAHLSCAVFRLDSDLSDLLAVGLDGAPPTWSAASRDALAVAYLGRVVIDTEARLQEVTDLFRWGLQHLDAPMLIVWQERPMLPLPNSAFELTDRTAIT